MLEKRQKKLIKYTKMNTIDYSSDEEKYFAKDWQLFLEKLGMLRKVVEGSLSNKTDAQLLSLLLNTKDINSLRQRETQGRFESVDPFNHRDMSSNQQTMMHGTKEEMDNFDSYKLNVTSVSLLE